MKILFIINDANVGGAQTLLEQLGACASTYSWECHLLVLSSPGTLSSRLEAVMKSVAYLGFERGSYRLDKLVVGVSRHIQGIGPDIVHSHLLQADLAAICAGLIVKVPLVSTVHTTGTSVEDPLRTRLLGRILGLLARNRVTASVACGAGAAVYMKRMGYGHNFHQIANGVSVNPSFPRDTYKRTGQLLNLARFHPMKDHSNLLEAFARQLTGDPEITPGLRPTLMLAGTEIDNSNEILSSAIAALNIADSVALRGVIDDVYVPLSESDALIISSSYGEALPMAGIEALAMGVPVIATDLGDCKSLTVDPQLLVPTGDSQALAAAMSYLRGLSDNDYSKLCRAAHRMALEKFSVHTTASRYALLYEEIVEGRAS